MNNKIFFIIAISYLVVVSVFLVWHRMWFSPDQFFAAAILLTLILGKFKQFVRDWSFPVMWFLGYEYLRGLVPVLGLKVHIYPMINFDKIIFGVIPTNKLQEVLFTNGVLRWYDYLATIFYMSHFIVFLIVGFIFWQINRKIFNEYFLALLLLSYAGFATYILFPAMPPWMAAQQNIIPTTIKIMDQVFVNFPQAIDLPSVYKFINANQVAAVPSLHAAYPWLTFLFMIRVIRYKGLLIIPYVLGVWFTIVYLGEHYVFDIVIGVLYATIAFLFVTRMDFIKKKINLSCFSGLSSKISS